MLAEFRNVGPYMLASMAELERNTLYDDPIFEATVELTMSKLWVVIDDFTRVENSACCDTRALKHFDCLIPRALAGPIVNGSVNLVVSGRASRLLGEPGRGCPVRFADQAGKGSPLVVNEDRQRAPVVVARTTVDALGSEVA